MGWKPRSQMDTSGVETNTHLLNRLMLGEAWTLARSVFADGAAAHQCWEVHCRGTGHRCFFVKANTPDAAVAAAIERLGGDPWQLHRALSALVSERDELRERVEAGAGRLDKAERRKPRKREPVTA